MKELKEKIVFSNDIKEIIDGKNAFDFKYNVKLEDKVFEDLRKSFKEEVEKIFKDVRIITEDEMKKVNNLISGDYPHCIFR